MADRADAHIRDLRSFLAVADELSFTRAAEALFVSQPALSKQVRALETRLNAELFTRGHRSVALTEAGTALVAPARRIVAATTEQRWVALPAAHPLARRTAVPFAELADEAFVALPASAGAMREFWLATDHRTAPARIGAEAVTADEAFEAVASGLGVALLAAGNAAIYRRDDVVCRPVPDLPPCRLAVMWRTSDRRRAVRVVADACCRCMAADQHFAPV